MPQPQEIDESETGGSSVAKFQPGLTNAFRYYLRKLTAGVGI